eukprot:Phypoly_transcript_04183.p1 GENE.Phypoly_transcript_04183~~Phypoly_transcript_04183.p1  ORF type:complete len:672 (+),score=113.63 Phypoly_transcript_04183:41-2056(+)
MATKSDITPTERKFISQHIHSRSIYNEAENYCVRVDYKNEKTKEPKKFVLVLGNNRIYFFKPAGKHQMDTHLFDVIELRSDLPKELTFKLRDDTSFTIVAANENDIHDIADAVSYLWNANFPGSPKPLNVYPAGLITESAVEVGPCGGFNNSYLAICDYLSQNPTPEIIWQSESYFGPKNITVFDFDVFGKKDVVITSDLRAIMYVLMNNSYFTELLIKKAKFASDGIAALALMVSTNSRLTKISITYSGIARDGCEKLVDGLAIGYGLPLTHLDLSGNPIEDKGMIALADFLKKYTRGLTYLNLSDCGSGSKGTVALMDALVQNDVFHKTLQTLKISGNRLDADGTKGLSSFLSKTGVLHTLAIADSNVNFLELRACVPLQSLNISANKITKKVIAEIAKMLPLCVNLKTLKLAKTNPPAEVLNELFKTPLPKLKELDLSDNDFSDENMVAILELLMAYDVLNTLNLSGNFNKNKQKHRHALVDSLVAIVARKHNPVEHLTMHSPKNPLKHDILPFILSLIDPKIRLRSLDITDHEIGDVGACSLGKVLQTNKCINTITWDGSATTVTGLDFFLHGLMRNQNMREHYIPVCDVAAIIKKAGESSATTATVQPLVELMQDRVATITRESVNVNKLTGVKKDTDSPTSPTAKQIAVRSLKPRRSDEEEPFFI